MPETDQGLLSSSRACVSTPGTIRHSPALRSVPNQETTSATLSRLGQTAVSSSIDASQSVGARRLLRLTMRALPVPVRSVTWSAPRIGVGNAIFFVLLGQLIAAATIDHFGLFGALKTELTARRALGLVVMAVGVYLAKKPR